MVKTHLAKYHKKLFMEGTDGDVMISNYSLK